MRLKINGKLFVKVVSAIMALGCGTILVIWFSVSFISWNWKISVPIDVAGTALRSLLIVAILTGLATSIEKNK